MGRGVHRGKIARFGWNQQTWSEATGTQASEPMGQPTYADAAAFEAAWTKHNGTQPSNPASISVAGIGLGLVTLGWNGGGNIGLSDSAYYSKDVTGLTPNTKYDVFIVVSKQSGYDITNTNVVRVNGVEAGAGVPQNVGQAVHVRTTSDASGHITLDVGVFHEGVIHNGQTGIGAITIRAIEGALVAQTLDFYLDAAKSWVAPRGGTLPILYSADSFTRLSALAGLDYLLKGTARRIPQTSGTQDDGVSIAGWNDVWQEFLTSAWDRAPLTFYPDVTDLGTSVPCVWIDPVAFDDPPAHDGPHRWMLEFTLRALTAFDGY